MLKFTDGFAEPVMQVELGLPGAEPGLGCAGAAGRGRPRWLVGAAAGLALGAAAAAQPSLTVSVRLSVGGGLWSDSVSVLPGSRVEVGIWVSAEGADYYGFAGGTMRLRVRDVEAGDQLVFAAGTETGRVAPFAFGAATNAIYHDDAATFRVDAASDAADASQTAGMTFFQRDPATAAPGTFSTANPALVFLCDYFVGANSPLGGQRFMLDELSRGVAAYFSAPNSSRPTTTDRVTFRDAYISPRPTPGSLGVLVLAGCLGRRRRAPD